MPQDPPPVSRTRSTLSVDDARFVALAEAIEETDVDARLLTVADRAAGARQAGTEGAESAAAVVAHRARKLVALADAKLPGIAALGRDERWWRRIAWGVPAGALMLGLSLDRLAHPHRLDLLSLPLLALVAWNLVVYGLLIGQAVRSQRRAVPDATIAAKPGPASPTAEVAPDSWPARIAAALSARAGANAVGTGAHGPMQAAIARRFAATWWRATSALQSHRAVTVMHAAAAAWGAGVALSILLRGLVVQYRVGWESTFLDAGQVHTLLHVLLAPALALLPGHGFDAAEVAALRFAETGGAPAAAVVAAGADGGARWALLYVVLLVVLIIVPRLGLATWQALRARRVAMRIDVGIGAHGSDYHQRLWSTLFPAQIRLTLIGGSGDARSAVVRWLRFAAGPSATDRLGESGPIAPPDSLLMRTDEGDELRLAASDRVDAPDRDRAPADVRSDDAHGRVELALRLEGESIAGVPIARLAAAAPREDELLAAIGSRLPPHAARGWVRLREGWRRAVESRMETAMSSLALQIADAAREREPIDTPPTSMRNLIDPGRRGDAQAARQAAVARLTERLARSAALTRSRFTALHGVVPPVGSSATDRFARGSSEAEEVVAAGRAGGAVALRPPADGFTVAGALHAPQAGMAGAASGAAMGASIDLLTGGLTLGAAAAVGAIIGGGAGLAAASMKNRAVDDGPGRVEVAPSLLQTLAEEGLVDWLGAAHAGRAPLAEAGLLPASAVGPAAWRGEVVAAVAQAEAVLMDAIAAVRSSASTDVSPGSAQRRATDGATAARPPAAASPERRLAECLTRIARQVMERASLDH